MRLALAVFAFTAAAGLAPQTDRPPASGVTIYHPDPHHLWNRLYGALFVRSGPDGREYGRDRADPLLWIGSKFLLQGPSHERAVRLLSEFVETRGETLVDDPLKRAVMQRDLWIVFDWLEGPHTNFLKPPLSDREVAELAKGSATSGDSNAKFARVVNGGRGVHEKPGPPKGWNDSARLCCQTDAG